jgi:periplasmic protein CpxP/Spy
MDETTHNRHWPAGFPTVLEDNTIMRKTVCTLALAGLLSLAGSAAALAQDTAAQPPQQGQWGHGPRGMNPEAQLEHLTKHLNLTAEQQAQIKPILESRDQQAKALWQDQSLAPADRHAKMQTIQQDSRTKIEAVLNDTQKQEYEAMLAKMQDRGQSRVQGPPPQQQ